MRILGIRGCNLASLAGEFAVELEQGPLAGAGLFAITGPTGAGKSTLLDALCVALFDRTPRLGQRSTVTIGHPGEDEELKLGATDVRALLRRGAGSGWAEVDFTGRDGHRYQARWSVRRARGRADGRMQAQQMELHDLDSGHVLGGTKSETLAEIQSRLGFTFDQFTRSALLAQGEFTAFLRASGRDRAELLERMTGTEIYGVVSEAAYRRAQSERAELEALERRVDEAAVLDDEAREQLARDKATAAETVEAEQKRLGELDAALAWHARGRELLAGVREADQRFARATRAWDQAAPVRAEIDRVAAALELAPLFEQARRARADATAGDEAVAGARAAAAARADELAAAERGLAHADERRATARQARAAAGPLLEQAGRLDTELELATAAAKRAAAALVEARGAETAAAAQRARLVEVEQQTRQRLDRAEAFLADRAALAPIADEWPRWSAALGRAGELAREIAVCDEARPARVAAVDQAETRARERADSAAAEREQHGAARLRAEKLENKAGEGALVALRRQRDRLESEREALRDLDAAVQAATAAAAAEERAVADRDRSRVEVSSLGRRRRRCSRDQTRRVELAREAEAALDRLRLAADLSAHRAALVDGEPCPLCGAEEHPWAQGSPVDAALAEQQARVTELRDRVRAGEAELAAIDAGRTSARAAVTRAEEALRELVLRRGEASSSWTTGLAALGELPLIGDPATAMAADWVAQRLSAIDERLESLRGEEQVAAAGAADAVQARSVEASRRSHLEHAVDEARRAAEATREAARAVATLDEARARATGERDRVMAELAPALAGVDGGVARAGEDAGGLRAELDGEVQAIGARRREREQCAAELAQLSGAVETAAARAVDRASERERAEAADVEARARAGELSTRRALLFGGRATAAVRAELDDEVAAADEARERAAIDAQRAEAAQASADTGLAAAVERAARTATERERAGGELSAALSAGAMDERELGRRLALGRPWRDTRAAERDRMRAELDEARAVLTERTAQHARHLETDAPEVDEESARAGHEGCAAALAAAREALADRVARLRVDDAARAARAELGRRADGQRERSAVYESLSELIGSADGKKFRQFAQSLTLDVLLAHANQHLSELASRYRLARVPGYDLDLQVIDRDMGDEVRSLYSLSGGESFLVSLALALGLSSLAARDARVESLLIDEGFGSLDPQTLESALSVLDALQATGRKVGLISHVPGLAERIGVQVQVTPRGGGKSIVAVAA